MADYIYLLENRLTPAQQKAIGALRTIARENDVTIFLTGGAVRDLTAGASVRDLDLTIQGDLSRMKKSLPGAGFEIVGENSAAHLLFLTYTGGVRVELGSTVTITWPKPGKPKYEPGSIIDDLRGRDFTANAMAISLNEGSYGLLMDPLNGVADIENRELRLVSNYGFIEDPSRLIRAVRLMARLGWQMEEKTRQRYDTAKEEGYISALNPWNLGYELEEIFHEEDPVRVLRALENEGWMQHLFPALQSGKVNTAALDELYDRQGQLQMQSVLSQVDAVAFPLLTAKLSAGEVAELKKLFARQGFVREIETLDERVKEFATRFASKDAATPSAAWKMLHSAEPNLVLAMSFGSKSSAVQSRLKTFLTESPGARQRIPYQLLVEMRITPELPGYAELLDTLFFQLMDNKLSEAEEMKAFLEPFSPPAPPPPPNLRRARARKETKTGRGRKKAAEVLEEAAEADEIPLTVAEEEEQEGLESGLTEVGDLTGPDRGPEPTPDEPIEKVAPTAAQQKAMESAAKKAAKVVAPAKAAKPAAAEPVKAAAVGPKAVPAPQKAVPPAKSAAPASKTQPAPAKKSAVKAAPAGAKNAPTAVKHAPAKPSAVKAASGKKPPAPPAKKSVPAKKATPSAKKSVPAKKVASAKKVAPVKAGKSSPPSKSAKKAPSKVVSKSPAKKAPPAKAAKKAAAKKPGRR